MNSPAESAHPGVLGGAVSLPARLIEPGEQIVLALKPSLWFIPLVSMPMLASVALLVLGLYLLGQMGLPGLPMDRVLALAVAAAMVRLFVALLQWMSRFYVLTDRRVLRVKGVLHVYIFQCPLERIQHTTLSLSLPERIFTTGTLGFATAGTGVVEAAWLIIARPTEVHEIVVNYIQRAQKGHGKP